MPDAQAAGDDPGAVKWERPVRIARICPKCNWRQFGDPDWTCPDHGVAVVQENRPYLGQPTTEAKGRG